MTETNMPVADGASDIANPEVDGLDMAEEVYDPNLPDDGVSGSEAEAPVASPEDNPVEPVESEADVLKRENENLRKRYASSTVEAQRLIAEKRELLARLQQPTSDGSSQEEELDEAETKALSLVRKAVREEQFAYEKAKEDASRSVQVKNLQEEYAVAMESYREKADPDDVVRVNTLLQKLQDVDPYTGKLCWLMTTGERVFSPAEAIDHLSGDYERRKEKAVKQEVAKISRAAAGGPAVSGASVPSSTPALPKLTRADIEMADDAGMSYREFAEMKATIAARNS